MSEGRWFLADKFWICGMMHVLEDHSKCPFFFKLVCVEIYVLFLEVFNNRAMCIRGFAGELDDIVS
jgi:hypothetical protein